MIKIDQNYFQQTKMIGLIVFIYFFFNSEASNDDEVEED